MFNSKVVLAAAAAVALTQFATAIPCKALVLSGGSNNGAWEAGVIWGLLHYAQKPEDYFWDVVSGISAGSINTIGIAGWKPEDSVEMSEFLSD